MRFQMIVYGLFYSCTVKGYNTGLQQWRDWRRYKGANLPPDKINAKTEPPFTYISIFSTFLVFSKLLFFAFFESFWTVIFRWFLVLVYRNQHPDALLFLNFFSECWRGHPTVALFQLRFPPYVLTINVDSANVTCTTASVPRLTTKLFAMVGFKKLWVVWRWISLTY